MLVVIGVVHLLVQILLSPCASSLRKMLDICSSFAMSHKLEFNANKTQLICFTAPGVSPNLPSEWNITNIGKIKMYHFDTMSSFFCLCTMTLYS